MRSLYTAKIEEERLAQYLPQVNMSDRDKEIVRLYLGKQKLFSDISFKNIAALKQGEALTEDDWTAWIKGEAKDHEEELTDEQIG